MNRIHLSLRGTYRYRDGYASHDDWEWLCEARATPPRWTADDGERAAYITELRVPAGATRRDARLIVKAIRDTMSGSNCTHEHDVCGCWSRYADARRVGRNRYRVNVYMSRNI